MFWKRLFNLFAGEEHDPQPEPLFKKRFGRYSDAFPAPEQEELRQESLHLFQEKCYLESYDAFFRSLSDEEEDNIRLAFYPEIQRLDFTLFQGSKVVTGYASPHEVVGEVRVVRAPELHVALSRRLMEINHSLLYSAFSLSNDQVICMRFSTQSADAYPGKLYSGLREIAIAADRQDDILLHEFSSLEPLDDQHVRALPTEEKHLKADFFFSTLFALREEIQHWESIDTGGTVSYLILSWTYKMDYLLTPEGPLLSQLEKIHQLYFSNKELSSFERNQRMRRELDKLSRISESELLANFYGTRSTFGVARPLSEKDWQAFSSKYLITLEWCRQHQQHRMAEIVLEFMAGYACFHFGMPLFLRALMHLLIRLFNDDFIAKLSPEETRLRLPNGEVDMEAVRERLALIKQNAYDEGFTPDWNNDQLTQGTVLDLGRRLFEALQGGDWGLH